jgi:hypothetical protein
MKDTNNCFPSSPWDVIAFLPFLLLLILCIILGFTLY